MMRLNSLDLVECAIDGPEFRKNLTNHEEYLLKLNSSFTTLMDATKNVFGQIKQLSQAFYKFANAIEKYGYDCLPSKIVSNDSNDFENFHECDRTILSGFPVFAKLIRDIEDSRQTFIIDLEKKVVSDFEELKLNWLEGKNNNNSKTFMKEMHKFYSKLDRNLAMKNRDQNSDMNEENYRNDRRLFMDRNFKYIETIHEGEERAKYQVSESLSLIYQMYSNFHHLVHESFEDNKQKIENIISSTQNFKKDLEKIKIASRTYSKIILEQDHETIVPSSKFNAREGYLNLISKKSVGSNSLRYFCSFNKSTNYLTMSPFNPTKQSENYPEEVYKVLRCIRRVIDPQERRYCFELAVEGRTPSIILQAQSSKDEDLWIDIFGGVEAISPIKTYSFPNPTIDLDNHGVNVLKLLIKAVNIESQGVYRVPASDIRFKNLQEICTTETSLAVIEQSILETKNEDQNSIPCCIKSYIRNLKEPLFTYQLYDKLIEAGSKSLSPLHSLIAEPVCWTIHYLIMMYAIIIGSEEDERISSLQSLVKELPPLNYSVLHLLMHHLKLVSSRSHINKMTSCNLSLVFSPTLARDKEDSAASIIDSRHVAVSLETLINYPDKFFTYDPGLEESSKNSEVETEFVITVHKHHMNQKTHLIRDVPTENQVPRPIVEQYSWMNHSFHSYSHRLNSFRLEEPLKEISSKSREELLKG